MRVKVLEAAAHDIVDAYWFYEDQEQGLGKHFRTSIRADIRGLSAHGGVHELHFDRYFRSISRRFPFAIYYTIESGSVIVYAVIDCRRDPNWITKRLM